MLTCLAWYLHESCTLTCIQSGIQVYHEKSEPMQLIDLKSLCITIPNLAKGYREGLFTPAEIVTEVYRRIAEAGDNPIWINRISLENALGRAIFLAGKDTNLPLYGIPCAVKDNIDVLNLATTAACPQAEYEPERNSFVVQRLIDAGAIIIGKTNLDQFATGLTGTRSPYGVCRNALNPEYISGGSSSGSAVAVALGQVCFALGTDTAGSGRVPAALNNVVGLKPTRGLLSNCGVIPASATLDCVSIFSLTVEDAHAVLNVMDGVDAEDVFLRHDRTQIAKPASGIRVGIPLSRQIIGLAESGFNRPFAQAQACMKALGNEIVEVDIEPLIECGGLLYGGAILAERYHALMPMLKENPEAILPVVRKVVEPGERFSGEEIYAAQHRVRQFKQSAEKIWQSVDVLLLPTVDATFTIDRVIDDPVTLNARLGRYTNFVNLLDMTALSIPAGFSQGGLPFGISLLAPALHDWWLGQIGARFQSLTGCRLGASLHTYSSLDSSISVAVVGAHLTGQPLNYQLLERGARLLKSCRTASRYRLYALPNTTPQKPGLEKLLVNEGKGIAVEVWSMPTSQFGSFVSLIPAPLGIGTLEMDDGEQVKGFVCEPYGLDGALDISSFGGWVAYLESLGK